MNIKKVKPVWQRLGFSSKEDMEKHEEKYRGLISD